MRLNHHFLTFVFISSLFTICFFPDLDSFRSINWLLFRFPGICQWLKLFLSFMRIPHQSKTKPKLPHLHQHAMKWRMLQHPLKWTTKSTFLEWPLHAWKCNRKSRRQPKLRFLPMQNGPQICRFCWLIEILLILWIFLSLRIWLPSIHCIWLSCSKRFLTSKPKSVSLIGPNQRIQQICWCSKRFQYHYQMKESRRHKWNQQFRKMRSWMRMQWHCPNVCRPMWKYHFHRRFLCHSTIKRLQLRPNNWRIILRTWFPRWFEWFGRMSKGS